ncbi:MAG: type II toxin-antitoxin system Phd/YefM family antitoxin [Nitrosomonadales bacterium]|nr:type II toxin-antitoxin system Phd/YefM family antitoxin [Nitrosomonadales bacterium]
MEIINIHEAKTNLSRIVETVFQGSEVILAKAGKPMAKIVPLQAQKRAIKFGVLKGKIRVADDFDEPLPDDVLALFEGK